MLRLANNIKRLSQACEIFCPYPSTSQSVRWGRKPRKPLWLPTAKSKLFRVSPRIRLPEDEKQELKRLYNNYRTQVRSLRQYFTEKYSVENQEQIDIEQHQKTIEEDFRRCSMINQQWNNEVKLSREQRTHEELMESTAQAEQRLKEMLKIHAERFQKAEEIVRREKDASEEFITPEKLDAAIEYAINNPVDYNYAIDLAGNKIHGRETKPLEKIESQDKMSVKQ